jgi:hypothetical protein
VYIWVRYKDRTPIGVKLVAAEAGERFFRPEYSAAARDADMTPGSAQHAEQKLSSGQFESCRLPGLVAQGSIDSTIGTTHERLYRLRR